MKTKSVIIMLLTIFIVSFFLNRGLEKRILRGQWSGYNSGDSTYYLLAIEKEYLILNGEKHSYRLIKQQDYTTLSDSGNVSIHIARDKYSSFEIKIGPNISGSFADLPYPTVKMTKLTKDMWARAKKRTQMISDIGSRLAVELQSLDKSTIGSGNYLDQGVQYEFYERNSSLYGRATVQEDKPPLLSGDWIMVDEKGSCTIGRRP